MAAIVQVRGLRETRNAFRKVDEDIPARLKVELLGIAGTVAGDIRSRVPRMTGAAAASVKARALQSRASIAFGGNAAPYFPWLDFGGTTGKGHRPDVGWSGSVKRLPFMGVSGMGRYVYPSITEHRDEIERAVEDAVLTVARSADFEVR